MYAASLKRPIFLHLCRIKLVKFILAFESWLIRFVGSPLLPTLTIHAGQTNHWVGSPSLKIQSSLRLGQPHPAFSMQTIINYLIVKYDQIIWGGNIVHKPTCCYLYTPVCDGTRIFPVRYLFSVSNFSGTSSDIFSGAKFMVPPQKT